MTGFSRPRFNSAHSLRAKAFLAANSCIPPICESGLPLHNRVVGEIVTPGLDRDQLRDVTLNDEELMREILGALVEDTSRQMKLLESAIQEQNATRCMHLAHYSKGACANLGAHAAAALFKEIEQRAAGHDFSQCTAALVRLAQEVDSLRLAAASV